MRVTLGCVLLILAASVLWAGTQTDIPSPRMPDRLAQEPFRWPQVAARLWSDSGYTFRQAALESYVDSARLPNHSVKYRESVVVASGRIVFTIVVDRPPASAEVGALLAFHIREHPQSEIIASVARETTSADAAVAGLQRLVIYMYVHLGEYGWSELFCIPFGAPERAVVDEGGPLSIPRCDDAIGGNPWPVATARGAALAYLKLFLSTVRGTLLPFLPFLLVFAALYLLSGRRRDGARAEKPLAGRQAGVLGLLLVLTLIVVAAVLTAAVYFVTRNPLAVERAFTSHHLKIAYQLAIPFALLVVIVVSDRVTTLQALISRRWREVAGVVLVLIPVAALAYGWAGHYRVVEDFLGLSWRGMMQDAISRARLEETMVGGGMIHLSILAFSLVVVGPVAEEIFWRGLALRILERHRGPFFAVVVSAVLFGLFHLSPWVRFGFRAAIGVGVTFLLGLVTGVVFVKRRSLGWCVAIHSAWNALVYVAALLVAFRGSVP